MIAAAFLLFSAATPDLSWQPLQNRNFFVGGWYCTGEGCESTPRRLGDGLKFSSSAHDAGLDNARRLRANWGIEFDCAVKASKLIRCRIVDDGKASSVATGIAVSFLRKARLKVSSSAEGRAIVGVNYEVGDCPSWMCTIIPPPPPAPN